MSQSSTQPGRRACPVSRRPTLLAVLVVLSQSPAWLGAQDRPVPILTGSAGLFTSRDAGQTEIVPVVAPVLLVPLGARWLLESRGEFKGEFERKPDSGAFGGQVEKEVDYAQLDFIASRYVTVTAGRFLTPFGIYNERLYPVWIRSLQPTPIIFPIGTGSSDGLMLRGGFPGNDKVNVTYAVYFSTLSTIDKLESDRLTGGRLGLFFPGPRIEIGASFQQVLQEERPRAAGFHFAWQPSAIPLNLRSEYGWSGDHGSGYWVEGALRLSRVSLSPRVMRHVEVVGRAQQFFAGRISSHDAEEYGLPEVNAQEGDLGLNYYFRDGLKATAGYGRRFASTGDGNRWTVGVAYRFAAPLGRVQ